MSPNTPAGSEYKKTVQVIFVTWRLTQNIIMNSVRNMIIKKALARVSEKKIRGFVLERRGKVCRIVAETRAELIPSIM